MGEKRGVYRVLVDNLTAGDHLKNQGVDGKITLGWIIRKWDVGAWIRSIWLRIVTGGGHV